jgi:hypothetical protein
LPNPQAPRARWRRRASTIGRIWIPRRWSASESGSQTTMPGNAPDPTAAGLLARGRVAHRVRSPPPLRCVPISTRPSHARRPVPRHRSHRGPARVHQLPARSPVAGRPRTVGAARPAVWSRSMSSPSPSR